MNHLFQRAILLFTLLLSFSCAAAFSAKAQSGEAITLSSLKVDIWSEYDRPSVLVIYHINLPPQVELPVELRFRIPSAAGEPHALAVKEADGSLVTISYRRVVLGEWSEVIFTTTLPEVQLEYYDPTLSKEGSLRSFHYQWSGDYAVAQLTIQIQQPLGATEMKIVPNTTNIAVGKDGLTYYVTQVDSLEVGQTFEVRFQYRKPNDSLTAESLKVQPSAPMGSVASTAPAAVNILPWLLGGLGIVLIVGAVTWWYWQAQRVKPRQKSPRPRRRRLVVEAQNIIPEGAIYCHHCGKRAQPADRFCRACGTRLRQ
jgi:hypothetical protein